ncbi:MAG: hypothetical protein ACTSSE_17230 [Candidatus Thorarchaeota archaeon]
MIFIKWRVSWFNGDENQSAEFWLPKGDTPDIHLRALFNLVELSAHDDGCKYELEKIGERACD